MTTKLLTFVILLCVTSTANAGFYYNQNWLPPRTHQICNDAFIWVEYNPKLEKRCRGLWTAWTNEIKNTLPY